MTTPEPEEETLEEPAPQLSISSTSDSDIVLLAGDKPRRPHKYRRVKKKKLPPVVPTEVNNIKGVRKLTLSFNTQQAIECIVGETITSEYPWKYIEKQVLQENLELHEVSSEFLPIAKEILAFPKKEILLVYIPNEQSEVQEFYVCLSEAAEMEVNGIIDNALKAREEKLLNSVEKTARKWKSQGSERDIKRMKEKIRRPLLEVELEAEYPVFEGKTMFKFRLTHNARDGYMEILSLRQKFDIIQRKQMDVAVQVNLQPRENYAQTVCVYPKNIGTQYYFEFPPLVKLTKGFHKNINYFVKYELDSLSEMLTVNSTVNYYRNDYLSLVRDAKFTQVPYHTASKYFTSLADPKICGKKQVASQDWHPMWSGTMAIAYSDYSNYEYIKYNPVADNVLSAIYHVSPVYLWTFKDFIEPRLLLETHREVATLSWCPYDENILVGGCINGQVVVWDITDRLKQVEEPELLNSKQIQYRLLLHSLMSWMRNTSDPKYVRSTVISDIAYSQRTPLTKIKWLSPYREITKRGKLVEIPEEEERSSLQFITTARDGTVAFWDLNATVPASASARPQRKLRRLKKRPSPLTVQVSPFRPLNRLLKPTYMLNIVPPKSDRRLPITSIFLDVTAPTYVERDPEENVNLPYDITRRVYYTPILNRDENPPSQEMLLATSEGDFMSCSWEGFDYNSGEVVNKEDVTFKIFSKYHDGPILSLAVSKLFPELVLTVGGNTFCLWLLSNKDYPAFWKRSAYKYTHGRWTNKRPSLFRISRQDGHMEFWHLKTRTDKYIDVVYVSSRGLGFSSTHPRPLDRVIMGIVEGKGYYELVQATLSGDSANEEDNNSTYLLCQKQIERKKKLAQWQEWWLTKNADLVNAIRAEQLRLQLEKEEKAKKEKAQQQEPEEQIEESKKDQTGKDREYKDYGEWAHEQMMLKEKERQLKLSMAKKNLDMELLLKQQQPLLNLKKELEEKEKKQQKRLERGTEFFDIAVGITFPEVLQEEPPPLPDPYAGGDPPAVRQAIFNDYKEIEQMCDKMVAKQQFQYRFSWIRAMDNGRERRKLLNGFDDRTFSHKDRFAQDRGVSAVEPTASNVFEETREIEENKGNEDNEENERMIEDVPDS